MRSMLGLIVLASGVPALSGGQEAQRDLKALEGTWKLKDGEWAGRKLTDEIRGTTSLAIFQGDRMTRRNGPKEFAYRIKLDPATKPKAIDILMLAGEKVVHRTKGIYELKGDVLRLCTAQDKDAERPTAFETSKDPLSAKYTWVIQVFQREKK